MSGSGSGVSGVGVDGASAVVIDNLLADKRREMRRIAHAQMRKRQKQQRRDAEAKSTELAQQLAKLVVFPSFFPPSFSPSFSFLFLLLFFTRLILCCYVPVNNQIKYRRRVKMKRVQPKSKLN